MQISLLLPVKNGMPHLKATIGGLLRQTYHDFELVVQDSCSTDDSVAYLRSLDTFFPIRIESRPDSSLVEGYNRAAKRCTSQLAVAIACDEVLDDNALETYMSWYHENPEAVFIYGGVRFADSQGRIVEVFQPKPFKLLDYIRHQMGATMAGVLNGTAIPPEKIFFLDESLSCVPDFEMFVRLALRFGEHRMICKEAITVTASASALSMTFRPEARLQFERDTLTVLERLLTGDLHNEFVEFLRADLKFNLYRFYAERLHAMSGDTDLTRRYIVLASKTRPHDPSLKRFAHMSRGFTWDERKQCLEARATAKPTEPPPGAVLIHSADFHTDVVVRAQWKSDGACSHNQGTRVIINTPAEPWHYAAVCSIPIATLDFERTWAWLKIHVTHSRGMPMLSLFTEQKDEIVGERAAQAEHDARDIYFDIFSHSQDCVLVRNGSMPEASEVEIESVELWIYPIPFDMEQSTAGCLTTG